ncbi:hypothetical protein JCM11641_004296 [Rhodosporidiobolus odoratus]
MSGPLSNSLHDEGHNNSAATRTSFAMNDLESEHPHSHNNLSQTMSADALKGGARFDSRVLSREGAGDLGHMARTIEETGYYKRVGNPGLIGLIAHATTLMLVSVQFMQWRGVTTPAAFVGPLWFFAGTYMLVVSIFTMTKGETFSSVVFATFGSFYWSYAAILTPAFGVVAAFDGDAVAINNALALFLFVYNAAFTCIFLASLRTNICLVIVFFGVIMGVWLLAGSYVELANLARRGLTTSSTFRALSQSGGAFLFISAMSGYYLVLVQMFESVAMPFVLPVGDLTPYWPKKKRS